jgi:hypothetical protein
VPSYTCLQPKDSALRNTRGCHMLLGEAMYPGPTLALLQLASPIVIASSAAALLLRGNRSLACIGGLKAFLTR